jgi:preprotein translocase subunit SecG
MVHYKRRKDIDLIVGLAGVILLFSEQLNGMFSGGFSGSKLSGMILHISLTQITGLFIIFGSVLLINLSKYRKEKTDKQEV